MIALLNVFFEVLFGDNGEIARLRWALISIAGAIVVSSSIIIILTPSVGVCFWVTLIPWVFSAYRLYSVRRFIGVIGVNLGGEALEFLGALIAHPTHPSTGTSVFDNEFIRAYLRIISGIFYAETGLFMLLPLYANYTSGGPTPIIIMVMISVVIFFLSLNFSARVLHLTMISLVVAYVFGGFLYLIPQAHYYLGLNKIQFVSTPTAKVIRDTDTLRNDQRDETNRATLEDARQWQEENPGKELPGFYKEVTEAAGGNLSLEEFRMSEVKKGRGGVVLIEKLSVNDSSGRFVCSVPKGLKVMAIGTTKGKDDMIRVMLPDSKSRFSRRSIVGYVVDDGIRWGQEMASN